MRLSDLGSRLLTPTLSEGFREFILVKQIFSEHFTANKFQIVTNVNLWSLVSIFIFSVDDEYKLYKSFLLIT